jgi:hypothetical protein
MMQNHIHLSSVAFQHANRQGNRRLNEPMVAFQPYRMESQGEAKVAVRPSWWSFLLALVLQ